MIPLRNRDFIAYSSNFLSEQEINFIHNHSEKLPVEDGRVFDLSKQNIRQSKVRWIYPDKDINWLYHKIRDEILIVNDEFFQFNIEEVEAIQHTTYHSPSGCYDAHMDSMSNRYPQRKISFSIQLSDENQYEGGDVLIYNNGFDDPYKVSRKKGDMVIFFSLLMHKVTPVVSGTRQSLVGWVGGPFLR